MEGRLGYRDSSGSGGLKLWPVYICFIAFGFMIPFTKPTFSFSALFISLFISLVVAFISINSLIMIFNIGNAELTQLNAQFAKEAVGNGMLFMIPFTILAIFAQFILGWDAVMPFASAAIMTACATAGAEVMKSGAKGIKNVMLPTGIAFVLSTSWMMLVTILP